MTHAQPNRPYETQWTKIEQSINKGLSRSAMRDAQTLLRWAQQDKRMQDEVKAAYTIMTLREEIDEDSQGANLASIDSLIAGANPPAKQIFLCARAKMIKQFLENEAWSRDEEGASTTESSNDLRTWSLVNLEQAYLRNFLESLTPVTELAKIPVEQLGTLVKPGKNTPGIRPTLFDLLAHEALEHLANETAVIERTSSRMVLNDSSLLAPAAIFIQNPILLPKPLESKALLVHVWQQIIQLRLQGPAPALLDADLIRLQQLYENHVANNKSDLYANTLASMLPNWRQQPEEATIQAALAQVWCEQAAKSTIDRRAELNKKAHGLASAGKSNFPNSPGGIACAQLIQQIEQVTIQLEMEQVELPNQAIRFLLGYRNLNQLHFRLVRWSDDQEIAYHQQKNDQQWSYIQQTKPLRAWQENLPPTNDFEYHRVELKIDPLPVGMYQLVVSIDSSFTAKNNFIGRTIFHVSNLALLSTDPGYFRVVQRTNGLPLSNVQVRVLESADYYRNAQQPKSLHASFVTDAEGKFAWENPADYKFRVIHLFHQSDSLTLNESMQGYRSEDNFNKPKAVERTNLLTDRAIYRPGQLVFFKGILWEEHEDPTNTKPLTQQSGTIRLLDANYQELSKQAYRTNSWGSYHGSFKLPEVGLTGEFTLEDTRSGSQQSVRVEAYKRPKFYTELQPPTKAYKLNDSIQITGQAKAYAGNPISNAKVRYRIRRLTRMPNWWARWYEPTRSATAQIGFGETQTDAKGNFQIAFQASPDWAVPASDQPTFVFQIDADVIDLNGETRSKSLEVSAAYQSIFLDWEGADQYSLQNWNTLNLQAKSISNEPIPATIRVECIPLQSPKNPIRKRYWQAPDRFQYTEAQFRQWFPQDEYQTESDPKTWTKKEVIASFDVVAGKPVDWNSLLAVQPGWYTLVASMKDENGILVRAEKQVEVLQSNGARVWWRTPLQLNWSADRGLPGENIQLTLTTLVPQLHVYSEMGNRTDKNEAQLSIEAKQPTVINQRITENDRGNVQCELGYVWQNRLYNETQTIQVPWTQKALKLQLQTFRTETLPGSEETWTLQVSDLNQTPVEAEVAASLYDASLDQFAFHQWNTLVGWPMNYNSRILRGHGFNAIQASLTNTLNNPTLPVFEQQYPSLIEPEFLNRTKFMVEDRMMAAPAEALERGIPGAATTIRVSGKASPSEVASVGYGKKKDTPKADETTNELSLRKDFRETAFFYPTLYTNPQGKTTFQFKLPEALTRWKALFLAHNQQLASGTTESAVTTRKLVMVQPNLPRFMREGDQMEIPVKVVNLDSIQLTGTVTLELIEATTNKPIDGWAKNVFPNQYVTLEPKQSSLVKFPIEIPYGLDQALLLRIIAKTEQHTDGEENIIPILPNRMLITESLSLQASGNEEKVYSFKPLQQSKNSPTLSHRSLIIEYSNNPLWYAIQSLPYLMEYPWDCIEQTVNRFYANQLAASVTQQMPKLKSFLDTWKTQDSSAWISALQQNQALKLSLLQETPWVLEAQSETEQFKRMSLLFDLEKMQNEQDRTKQLLADLQLPNGAFPWFKGGYENLYMTQYLLQKFGHLRKLGALSENQYEQLQPMLGKAMRWLDEEWTKEYETAQKRLKKKNAVNQTAISLHYLYIRSFFPDVTTSANTKAAVTFWINQAQKNWLQLPVAQQAMLALVVHRQGKKRIPNTILTSLKDRAIRTTTRGTYWKDWQRGGMYWYQAPIENQSLLIELFRELPGNHSAWINELKTWLLLQKQTQHWGTTKATAEACYALLLNEENTLTANTEASIQLGAGLTLTHSSASTNAAGSWKKTIPGNSVEPEMGDIKLRITNAESGQLSWGAVHWQYFEQLDQIKSNEQGSLSLKRLLFREINTEKGNKRIPITAETALEVGDKIVVQLQLNSDRLMEYVHVKDMRAANLEPLEVVSEYKYTGNIGYYQSTADASTNFFLATVPRGVHLFEYKLTVQQAGNCGMGISSAQCLYAPQFSSHTESIRITGNDE